MADRGFTIKESLSRLNVGLNLPPFMEGCGQLPPEDVQQGRSIASLRIHVERAIGRMKQYNVLTSIRNGSHCKRDSNCLYLPLELFHHPLHWTLFQNGERVIFPCVI